MKIADIHRALDEGASVREVVEEALSRAKNDTSNSLISTLDDRALQRADEIDRELSSGAKRTSLMGVPFIAKDNILTFGAATTAASKMLKDFHAPYQATVIEKLEAAGAICIAKANLDSFAHGGSTENSYFGPTSNAHDSTRVAGGSSGGSAASVAMGIVPFALGSDTGGSIRQPASFNGTVGLKPTYGSVSRYGVVAMASSTDVVGPLTTCSEDAELVYDAIRGVDERDGTTIEINDSQVKNDSSLRIGVISEAKVDGVDESIASNFLAAIKKLEAAGHAVQAVSVPRLPSALAVYYIVVPAEVSSNLARYDGIKYGVSHDAPTIAETYKQNRSDGFMDENKRRILIGNYVLSSGYYDAYYNKAQSVRTLLINDFNAAFEKFDVLITPTAPTTAFKLGEKIDDPLTMYLADVMTVPMSLAGLPAISVPSGVDDDGLPIGLQIIANKGEDKKLLAAAKIWEDLNS